MRSIFLTFILGFTFSCIISAQNDFAKKILFDTGKYANAIIDKDISGIMDYMHPNIVKMGGGDEFMKTQIEQQINVYSDQNISLTNIVFDTPGDIVQAGDELHCIVQQTQILKMGDKDFENKGNLLAVSQDNGESWKFVDLAQYDANSLKIFIPNFNEALKIPTIE